MLDDIDDTHGDIDDTHGDIDDTRGDIDDTRGDIDDTRGDIAPTILHDIFLTITCCHVTCVKKKSDN